MNLILILFFIFDFLISSLLLYEFHTGFCCCVFQVRLVRKTHDCLDVYITIVCGGQRFGMLVVGNIPFLGVVGMYSFHRCLRYDLHQVLNNEFKKYVNLHMCVL